MNNMLNLYHSTKLCPRLSYSSTHKSIKISYIFYFNKNINNNDKIQGFFFKILIQGAGTFKFGENNSFFIQIDTRQTAKSKILIFNKLHNSLVRFSKKKNNF